MRRIVFAASVIVVAGGMFVLSGCTKCAPKKKVLSAEEVANAMAPVICEKYASCQQGQEFQKEQCVQDVLGGVSGRLKELAEVKVDQVMLEGCLKALKDAPCEALSSPTPPEGCKFLE